MEMGTREYALLQAHNVRLVRLENTPKIVTGTSAMKMSYTREREIGFS